ncbi:glycosyltransferase [Butyrivibrio fibrisolvens]|uniref:glycosyltransferase family 4 protein n=1 Tax=Pseudobutyrivibrio ruminis TaxID=46206 RepID=UPI0003FBF33A|nr:glycosyltransferase family 4 protein [Pseudobutyrivibrio ruminis]MDC7279106.1 glycosyltransferase [Butyrivibrio fibrisolvens]
MQRKQITAVNHYDVYPFNHGGSLGIRGLYKALSEWVDVNLITLVRDDSYADEIFINNHIKIIPIKVPKEFDDDLLKRFMDSEGIRDVDDVDWDQIIIRYYHENIKIIDEIRRLSKDSILVIAEHVYTWKLVKLSCPDKHLWYRANNVEYDYKKTLYGNRFCKDNYLKFLYDFEKDCCYNCEKIMTVSQLEADRFIELYQCPEDVASHFMDIKSGYDADSVSPILPSKRRIDDGCKYHGLYIASATVNAFDAAKYCVEYARSNPTVKMFIVGSVCFLFKNEKDLPSNVEITGIVSDERKINLLSSCDFAMNLMETGAGINVKMFEYFAYGIPVITTSYGARGINMEDGVNGIITTPDTYIEDINTYLNESEEKKDQISNNARKLLEKEYSWRSLGRKIIEEIDDMYGYDLINEAVTLDDIKLYSESSIMPDGKFYIRCAGLYGTKTLSYMRSNGYEPESFIDTDKEKIGTLIDGLNVISESEYIDKYRNYIVIVASSKWDEITAELLSEGVPEENIYISWEITGESIIRFSDMQGKRGFVDWERWKRRVLSNVNR